jgi:hypothetical protein
MKTKQPFVCGLLAVLCVLLFLGCKGRLDAQEQRLTGPTAVFSFTKIKGGNEYSVSINTAATGAVSIPAYYRPNAQSDFLPVTEIRNGLALKITSVTIPSTVTTIGLQAFWECTSLTSITIPTSVTTIDMQAFLGCTSLTSITIPESVTAIGQQAFEGCTGLTSITLPAGVTINTWAFRGCTGIKEITIPAGATLRECVFGDWFTAQTIYIEGHATRESTIAAKWGGSWDKDNLFGEIPTYAKIVYKGK